MAKRQVFYSFHFKNDVMRVQQVRTMGVIEGNEPTSPNNWEELKRKGDNSIKKWITDNMKNRSCIIVLIGSETADRRWVEYEIKKAWSLKKAILGIHIHNLNCPNTKTNNGKSKKGKNPFESIKYKDGTLADFLKCYNPNSTDTYKNIQYNIADWIEEAISIRNNIDK